MFYLKNFGQRKDIFDQIHANLFEKYFEEIEKIHYSLGIDPFPFFSLWSRSPTLPWVSPHAPLLSLPGGAHPPT
jgi:hypothetical protein